MASDSSRQVPPARKRFGQHFLTDPSILSRIVSALDPKPEETVVEIGPGRGALTEHLIQRGARVTAIEIDPKLVPLLRSRFADELRLTVVEADVLETSLGEVGGAGYALVGNIPYNITTPIIFHALKPPLFSRAVFLVQREVADRLAAAPGSENYGALTINVSALATVETVQRVPAGAFQPPPKVESAVIRLRVLESPVFPVDESARYARMVIDAFTMRRKQMRRVVRSLAPLDAVGADRVLGEAAIDPMARPETLTPHDFARLGASLSRLSQ